MTKEAASKGCMVTWLYGFQMYNDLLSSTLRIEKPFKHLTIQPFETASFDVFVSIFKENCSKILRGVF
jgi:hypothetical protein